MGVEGATGEVVDLKEKRRNVQEIGSRSPRASVNEKGCAYDVSAECRHSCVRNRHAIYAILPNLIMQ